MPEIRLYGSTKEHQSSKPEWQYADGVDSPPNLFCVTSNAYTEYDIKSGKTQKPRPNFKTGLLKDVRRGINLVDNRWDNDGDQCGIPMDGKRVNPNDVGFKLGGTMRQADLVATSSQSIVNTNY